MKKIQPPIISSRHFFAATLKIPAIFTASDKINLGAAARLNVGGGGPVVPFDDVLFFIFRTTLAFNFPALAIDAIKPAYLI